MAGAIQDGYIKKPWRIGRSCIRYAGTSGCFFLPIKIYCSSYNFNLFDTRQNILPPCFVTHVLCQVLGPYNQLVVRAMTGLMV